MKCDAVIIYISYEHGRDNSSTIIKSCTSEKKMLILKIPIILWLINCEVDMAKYSGEYLERSFDVQTEQNDVATKN